MLRQVLAIASVLLFFDLPNTVFFVRNTAKAQIPRVQRNCTVIALVLNSGDLSHPSGSQLCQGDRVNGTVQILCHLNRTVLQLQPGSISDAPSKCVPGVSQSEKIEECNPPSPTNCLKIKGPNSEQKPLLTNPKGFNILDTRPTLSWLPIDGATYTLHIQGNGIDYWSQKLSNTSLPYPKSLPPLELGNAYRVDVIAQVNNLKSASSTMLFTLPQSKAQSLSNLLKQIRSFKLSQDDYAINTAIAYLSEGVLTEAINTLGARAKAGTQNSLVYQLIVNCYQQARLPVDPKFVNQRAYISKKGNQEHEDTSRY